MIRYCRSRDSDYRHANPYSTFDYNSATSVCDIYDSYGNEYNDLDHCPLCLYYYYFFDYYHNYLHIYDNTNHHYDEHRNQYGDDNGHNI